MMDRRRVVIHGAVQGVGFRPFVHALAQDLHLAGWVQNDAQGVVLEVEGSSEGLDAFSDRLHTEAPPHAVLHNIETTHLHSRGYSGFHIRLSEPATTASTWILPDLATCEACRQELFDPSNRRYRYPFLNCTHCGPRFSIIDALPYDRPRTAMRNFEMCPACTEEYQNPADRRFHAQPTACPDCGPQVTFLDCQGHPIQHREEALNVSLDLLRQGKILAVKGLGGFHLMVDARNEEAVQRLRSRKCREEKPLAVMFPSVDAVRVACTLSTAEQHLLTSSAAPIVLLDRNPGSVAESVAPGNRSLGVMLPYTPLHHLLLHDLGFPVVATSGNRTDEPICIDTDTALTHLSEIADGFLVHDRPIRRRVDDSVTRILLGREQVWRRARGYAPLPITLDTDLPTILAVGAHQKNTVALSRGRHIFLSPHLGDLETPPARAAFAQTVRDLPDLYGVSVNSIACDLHPDYPSTTFAHQSGSPCVPIQHHLAHVLSCMTENDITPPVLGVAWDGTGLGTDGTGWGGEFLLVENDRWSRIAHLRRFRLPGGDACAREPWRCALGLRYEMEGEDAFTEDHPPALRRMLREGLHAPWTSSIGRLFDAVASLLGLRDHCSFEGQAAIELEQMAGNGKADPYPIQVGPVIDWQPMIEAMRKNSAPISVRAARFHQTLVHTILQVAQQAGPSQVVLSGGCFQNRLLVEQTDQQLRTHGLHPVWHQRIPPNDGGISLGQLAGAIHPRSEEPHPSHQEQPPCVWPSPAR